MAARRGHAVAAAASSPGRCGAAARCCASSPSPLPAGALVDGLRVEAGPHVRGGRGVVATREITAGDVLLEVPLAACTRPDPAAPPNTPWPVALAAALLRRQQARGAPDDAWLGSLPAAPVGLAYGGEATAEVLQFSDAVVAAGEARWFASDAHRRLAGGGWLGLEVTEQDAAFALSMVHSRTCRCDGDGGRPVRLLVPFFDMLNHDDDPHVDWELDPAKEVLRLHATRAAAEGEEVCTSYGDDKTNLVFALYYGFSLEANPNDTVPLFESLLDAATWFEERSGAPAPPEALSASGDDALLVGWGGQVDGRLIDLFAAQAGDGDAGAARAAQARARELLEGLPTTLEEDDALLAGGAASGDALVGLQFRASRKRLLREFATLEV